MPHMSYFVKNSHYCLLSTTSLFSWFMASCFLCHFCRFNVRKVFFHGLIVNFSVRLKRTFTYKIKHFLITCFSLWLKFFHTRASIFIFSIGTLIFWPLVFILEYSPNEVLRTNYSPTTNYRTLFLQTHSLVYPG